MATVLLAAAPALAQQPKALIKNPQHWGAFVVTEKGGIACYMAGQPIDTRPKNVRRGKVWLLVTHRPYRKVRDEVSIYTGYPYRKDSKVSVQIDTKKFEMFTDKETAWAADAATDTALVKAMRDGIKMVVRGTSSRGTNTTDSYTLRGFTKAHEAINKACAK